MYVHVPDVSDVVTRRRARSMTQLNGLHGQRSTVGARPRGRFEHMSQVLCRNWRVVLQSVAVEPMTGAENVCPALAKLSCQTAGARKTNTLCSLGQK